MIVGIVAVILYNCTRAIIRLNICVLEWFNLVYSNCKFKLFYRHCVEFLDSNSCCDVRE